MAESKKFLLRLDPRLFESLRRWAQDDVRSINGQIEYLLTEQAHRAGRLPRHGSRPHPGADDEAGEPSDGDGPNGPREDATDAAATHADALH